MAVILQSATRTNPAPCMHFGVTLAIDGGRTVTLEVQADELSEPITDDDMRAALKCWARYQRSKGKTLAQMVGGVVFGEIA